MCANVCMWTPPQWTSSIFHTAVHSWPPSSSTLFRRNFLNFPLVVPSIAGPHPAQRFFRWFFLNPTSVLPSISGSHSLRLLQMGLPVCPTDCQPTQHFFYQWPFLTSARCSLNLWKNRKSSALGIICCYMSICTSDDRI